MNCTPPDLLVFDYWANPGTGNLAGPVDVRRSQTNIGTCFGLPAGNYTIEVHVGQVPGVGLGDAITGWSGQYWSLEAEEVY